MTTADIDPRAFRNVLGQFCTGITIITTVHDGAPVGFACQSFAALSLDPPLVLFSLDRRAYSVPAFHETGAFAINVLSDSQRHLSQIFATALIDKWDNVSYELWNTGCPILTDALACFECKTQHIYDGGDHLIFVGRVTKLRYDTEAAPLLYFRGAYRRIGEHH